MKKIIFILMMVTALIGCGGDSSSSGSNTVVDDGLANIKADEGFSMISDLLESIIYTDVANEIERDFSLARTGEDICLYADYKAVKDLFADSISNDPSNAKGHLGMAAVELAELNYNTDVWNVISQILKFEDEQNITITASQIDTLLSEDLSAAIDRSIAHLDITLADTAFTYVNIPDTDNEPHYITKSEIYLARAYLYGVKSLIKIVLVYDIQPVSIAGNYSWVNGLNVDGDYLDWNEWDEYSIAGTDLTLTKTNDEADRDNMILMFQTLRDRMITNDSFLKIKSGESLSVVKTYITSALNDLKNAYNTVMAQTGDVSNNLIKKSEIEDLNADILSDNPLEKGWDTCLDIIVWVEGALSNSVTVTVNDPDDLTINISAFFSNQIVDVKDLLPYHSWKDEGVDYVNWYSDEPETDEQIYNPQVVNTDPLTFGTDAYWLFGNNFIDGDPISIPIPEDTSIGKVIEVEEGYQVDPVELLDGDGGLALEEGDFLVFPDYTFGGLYPGMDKASFEAMFELQM